MTSTPAHPIVGIIQARMGSTRLPGKALLDLAGAPFLARVVERMRHCQTLDALVLATTTEPSDDPLVELAESLGVSVYRGSVDDVLDRFTQAARQADAALIVRITADDPFKDPQVTDHAVRLWLRQPDLDYVSNTLEPTYPEGLDIEVFTREALERAWREARLPSEREHVTPYIWKHPDRFRLLNFKHERDLSHLRWTVDYPEDLAFAREVYARLYRPGQVFLMEDILRLLEAEPELARINAGIQRNEGYLKSLAQDAQTGAGAPDASPGDEER